MKFFLDSSHFHSHSKLFNSIIQYSIDEKKYYLPNDVEIIIPTIDNKYIDSEGELKSIHSYLPEIHFKFINKIEFPDRKYCISKYKLLKGLYSEWTLIQYITEFSDIDFQGNSTARRYGLRIKNIDDSFIFGMDTELNGNCVYGGDYYDKYEYDTKKIEKKSWKGRKEFKINLQNCLEFCLKLLKEIEEVNNIMNDEIIDGKFNRIKKCKISGSQSSINLASFLLPGNTRLRKNYPYIIYVIEKNYIDDNDNDNDNDNELSEWFQSDKKLKPLFFIQDSKLLSQLIEYQMRYSRYLKTDDGNSYDFYPRYNHNSEQLLKKTCDYLDHDIYGIARREWSLAAS